MLRIPVRLSIWIFSLVMVPTVPLLAFLIYSGFNYASERQAALEKTLISEAERLSSLVRDQISRSEGYVKTLSLARSAKEGDIPRLYDFSRRFDPDDTGIEAIALVDQRERTLMMSLAPLGKGDPVYAIESVRNVFRNGTTELSGPFAWSIGNRPMVALSVPVQFRGETKYALQAVIGTDTISHILESSDVPNGWVASVLDSNGVIVARSHSADLYAGKFATPDVREELSKKNLTPFSAITKDGESTQAVLRPIGNRGWYLIVGVPQKILSAPLRKELIETGSLSLLLMSLCVAAAVWFSRKFEREIRKIVWATNHLERGVDPPVVETGIVELNQMSASICNVDKYNKTLERRVAARTKELEESRRRAATFSEALEKSVELERQRIAREVHDQIGSILSGIGLLLSSSPDGQYCAAQMKDLENALALGIDTARRISSELHPPQLDDFGLASALRAMLHERLNGLGVSQEVDLKEENYLSDHQKICCYRIVQEACTNVIRHSRATHFSIKGFKAHGSIYKITISDNGIGMHDGPVREGALGLVGMIERSRLLGGSLEIDIKKTTGFSLNLSLPILAIE